jgi:4-diphosphocytidyl-2-C-methyl-D-erythritol kinase
VLKALNELSGAGLGMAEMVGIAAKLGSDIPFFLYGSPCRCRGRGEHVEPVTLPVGGQERLILVKPEFGVSTPWAYGRWRESEELAGVDYAPQAMSWGEMVNDLERPVFEKYLFLAELKGWLRAQPEIKGALMSGSGSTTFAVLGEGYGLSGALEERIRSHAGEGIWVTEVEAWFEPPAI